MGLVNGVGNIGSLYVSHFVSQRIVSLGDAEWTRQDGVVHMASQLGSGVPSVDDHRTLQSHALDRLGFG